MTPAPLRLSTAQLASWASRGKASALGHSSISSYWEWSRSALDLPRFERAWRRLVARHEVLHTVIKRNGTQEVVSPPRDFRLPLLDLRSAGDAAGRRELRRLRSQMSCQERPLDGQPLTDVKVTLLPSGEVRIHLWIDAMVADEWSVIHVLVPDLLRYYADDGEEPPPGARAFRDHVLSADRAVRSPQRTDSARGYWLDLLESLPPGPSLPSAATPEPQPMLRRLHWLPSAQLARLTRRAENRGLTLTALLTTALSEVLRTWSSSERFTLNRTVFEPPFPDSADSPVAGAFAMPSLLAVEKLDGTFTDRALALQRRMTADGEHSAFSVMRVLAAMSQRLEGDPRTSLPVVVTSLLKESRGPEEATPGVLRYAITHAPQATLQCRFSEEAGALRTEWFSRERTFAPGVVDAMFAAYGDLLDLLADAPGSWEQERFALVPADQLARRAEVNATEAPKPDHLLHEAIARHARSQPDAPAVISTTRLLTYRELSSRVNQVGRRLRELAVTPNQLVAVVMEKGWEQIVAVHGILAAGGAYLPIDPEVPVDRLRRLLDYGQVGIVLTQGRLDPALDWPPGLLRLAVDRDFEGLDDHPLASVQKPTDLAYVIFTSGSTGVPKGVMIDHRGALNTITDINRRFLIGPDDRCLAVSALHFDLSVYDAFGMTEAGGAVVIPDASPRPDPGHWSLLMDRFEVTFWNSVPALLEMLVMYLEHTGRRKRIQRLRLAILAGDWIPVSLPDRLRALNGRTHVIASGGPAETCVWSVINPLDKVDPTWTSIPYGRPMANQRYHILDRNLCPCPDWVPGEIYIASEVGLAKGYWRDRERSDLQFLTLPSGERAYASGDLGRYLPDGDIEILGRTDFQVKLQGVRIELGEIEAALLSHPDVRSAVVVATGGKRDLPVLHAWIVWAEREPAGGVELLRSFLGTKLPAFMVPPLITAIDRLPLTGNGKIDRLMLSRRHQKSVTGVRTEAAAPTTPLEPAIREIIADFLGVARVGSQDAYLRLGGDPLRVPELLQVFREKLGAEISFPDFLGAASVAEVCAMLATSPSPTTR